MHCVGIAPNTISANKTMVLFPTLGTRPQHWQTLGPLPYIVNLFTIKAYFAGPQMIGGFVFRKIYGKIQLYKNCTVFALLIISMLPNYTPMLLGAQISMQTLVFYALWYVNITCCAIYHPNPPNFLCFIGALSL